MISKIVFAVAVVAACAQKHGEGHEQRGYSHAISIVHHAQSEHHNHHAPAHHEQLSALHAGPVHHAAPDHYDHVSVRNAARIYHAAPIYQAASVHKAAPAHQEKHHHEEKHHDYYAHPMYEFEYAAEGPNSRDRKSQHKARDGDVVKGYYSLHNADGSIRSVVYDSDKHTGFKSYVKRSEPVKHIQPERHAHH